MARTRMKPRMCTGGHARRVSLDQQVEHAEAELDTEMRQDAPLSDTQYCSMCQDGGELWVCDETGCGRAVCFQCITVPSEEVRKLEVQDVKFTCISCHWKLCSRKDRPAYFGFTIGGRPVLSKPLEVKGAFDMATNAKVESPPTVIIHIRLHSIRHLAHFTIVHQLLAEYYGDGDDDRLRMIDIPYNVGHQLALKEWNDDAPGHMAGLSQYKHKIVFVTAHSDPDRGDLWLGEDETKQNCATSVGEWIPAILGPFKAILRGSMVFLLACGAIVNNSESFADVRKGLKDLEVQNALAFDAKRLSPLHTVDLLMKLAKEVVIHGFEFTPALEHLLGQSLTLGKHTNILHFSPKSVTKYLWTHKVYQPWGRRLPLQCPQCGTLNPWQVVFVSIDDRQGYRVECVNINCVGDLGRYRLDIWRPARTSMISVGKDGGWLIVANYDNPAA